MKIQCIDKIKIDDYDAIIVGSGFSGSIIARKFADDKKKVLMIEKRSHLSGNMYDYKVNNVFIHKYGPHILYLNNDKVYNFLNRFSKFNEYKHKVYAQYNNNFVPLPINNNSLRTLLKDFPQEKVNSFIDKNMNKSITIHDLKEQEYDFWNVIYKNIFENYSSKMWGCDPTKLDKFVMNRIPITFNDIDFHFKNKYQLMPKKGYSNLFKNMLNDKRIEIILNCNFNDYFKKKNNSFYFNGEVVNCPIIYTGMIDELLDFKFGELRYRSLKFTLKIMKNDINNNIGTINFPSHPYITRRTNFNILNNKKTKGKNVYLYEEPYEFNYSRKDEPFYPLPLDEEKNKFSLYIKELRKYKNLYLLGRLAEYKYINMESTIINAFNFYEFIKKEINNSRKGK